MRLVRFFFSLSTIMSALANFMATSDSCSPPRIARSQTHRTHDPTPGSPSFGWAPSSPLIGRGGPSATFASTAEATPSQGNADRESQEGFTPLTPPPRRGLAPQRVFSGPTPAQRRRASPASIGRSRDTGSFHVASSPLGRRAREEEEMDANPFDLNLASTLSPSSRKKRRGIARSVSITFGLPEQSLDKFSEVCC
jgi:hypothetical protein